MFRCPNCKRPTLCRVLGSESKPPRFERTRQRECRECAHRFVTREVLVSAGEAS
jgi:transcriptional regulator NrdR family protein